MHIATSLSSDDDAFSYVLNYLTKSACFSAGKSHLKPELYFYEASEPEREILRVALRHYIENEREGGNKVNCHIQIVQSLFFHAFIA